MWQRKPALTSQYDCLQSEIATRGMRWCLGFHDSSGEVSLELNSLNQSNISENILEATKLAWEKNWNNRSFVPAKSSINILLFLKTLLLDFSFKRKQMHWCAENTNRLYFSFGWAVQDNRQEMHMLSGCWYHILRQHRIVHNIPVYL